MHEIAAHPDAARLFGLLNAHSGTVQAAGEAGGGTMFQPWPTTGVPLAAREDWRSVLEAAAAGGVRTLWVAFHGVGEVHDRQVNHRGGYAGTCQAIERARAVGLSVGCNAFLTAESLLQLDELIGVVSGLAGTCFELVGYLPTPRSRADRAAAPYPALPGAGRGPARGASRSREPRLVDEPGDPHRSRLRPAGSSGAVAGDPRPRARRARPGVPA
jgi:hypothetical protein